MERYEQVYEGDWEPWGWKNNLEMCCDCCMVHKASYRVRNGALQRRVTVDRRRTYAARRRTGIKLVKTKGTK